MRSSATDDLRFDTDETRRLFYETYRHPLEQELLDALTRTTDGWAATLRLTESAVRGRPREEVRAIIRGLSGREGDVHDYLAEEVVDRMPSDLQAFAGRCSLLELVTTEFASVAAEVSLDRARQAMESLERAGLLARRGRMGQAGRSFHPLVRSFLEGRLVDEVGPEGVREIHARVAATAEHVAWAVAARHFVAAARPADAARVLIAALPAILGVGGYLDAIEIADHLGSLHHGAWVEVIRAHQALRIGDYELALACADAASMLCESGDRTVSPMVAAAARMNVHYGMGNMSLALADSSVVLGFEPDGITETLASGVESVVRSLVDGDLAAASRQISDISARMERLGLHHYRGIAELNRAWIERALLHAPTVRQSAEEAIENLRSSSGGLEVTSALTCLAWAHAHDGRPDDARAAGSEALSQVIEGNRYEALVELAEIHGTYLQSDISEQLLNDASGIPPTEAAECHARLVRVQALMRRGELSAASALLATIDPDQVTPVPGFRILTRFAGAVLAVLRGSDQDSAVDALEDQARTQNSQAFVGLAKVLRAFSSHEPAAINLALVNMIQRDPGQTCLMAEIVAQSIAAYSEGTLALVRASATTWPDRWRPVLRSALAGDDLERKLRTGRLLEIIGDASDVRLLRNTAKQFKGSRGQADLGRSLARRLAPRILIEDFGQVVIRAGRRELTGADVRPKALAMLCFLASQREFSATRDQVLDALWPESDPEQATNSLHQTAYFLRRSLEEDYDQDTSPGYLLQDGDVMRLDRELVDSRSHQFQELVRLTTGDPEIEKAEQIAGLYSGPFATDFMYEDWAASIRDAFHARYVEVMERAVRRDMEAGQYSRALALARRMLEVDPGLDEIERVIVRLYRMSGFYAAAAEQYAHYSASLADLGVEVPPIENL